MRRIFILSVLGIFVVLTAIFFWMKSALPDYNFVVLITANIVMAALSIISHYFVTKQVSSKPDAFVRGVYSSSFLKLFVCIISITIYASMNKGNLHKPTLFCVFGVYAVYSALETWLSSKMAKYIK